MAASVRITGLTVDRYLDLGPGIYTPHFPDRMSCLPIPYVLSSHSYCVKSDYSEYMVDNYIRSVGYRDGQCCRTAGHLAFKQSHDTILSKDWQTGNMGITKPFHQPDSTNQNLRAI